MSDQQLTVRCAPYRNLLRWIACLPHIMLEEWRQSGRAYPSSGFDREGPCTKNWINAANDLV